MMVYLLAVSVVLALQDLFAAEGPLACVEEGGGHGVGHGVNGEEKESVWWILCTSRVDIINTRSQATEGCCTL